MSDAEDMVWKQSTGTSPELNLVNPESDKGLQSKSYNIQIIENKTMNTQPMPDATIRTNIVCKAFFSRPSWLRSETQPAQQEIQISEW
jgi:hypothetical protein